MDEEIEIAGWVETTRSHGKIGFVVVRDGTGVVQVVVPKKELDAATWEAFGELAQETTVGITGTVRQDDRAPGGYEMTMTGLEVIAAPVDEYPIQPKEHGVEFLLDHRHLWLRSTQQRATLRVRDEVDAANALWTAGEVRPTPGFVCRDCPVFDLCREGRR